jgi:hypothetical protein
LVVFPEIDIEIRAESNLVRLEMDMPSPSTPTHQKSRWPTRTLQEAQEQVGAPSVRTSIPPRRYANHVVLISSICEPSDCFEEERCDALMEDDVWVDSEIIGCTYLQIASLVELQSW